MIHSGVLQFSLRILDFFVLLINWQSLFFILSIHRSNQIKARKVLEAEKARTLFDFEADRRQVKLRASGMGDENLPVTSTGEIVEYRKKAP